jgi:hypothetical protein
MGIAADFGLKNHWDWRVTTFLVAGWLPLLTADVLGVSTTAGPLLSDLAYPRLYPGARTQPDFLTVTTGADDGFSKTMGAYFVVVSNAAVRIDADLTYLDGSSMGLGLTAGTEGLTTDTTTKGV